MALIILILLLYSLTITARSIDPDLIETTSSTIPIGAIIDHCTVPGTVALTFDDGPFIYTTALLDILREYDAQATFFLLGHGLGDIYSSEETVLRIMRDGHQIGAHTWNHPSLLNLPYATIVTQMLDLERAFVHIIGQRPTYMRPPYLYVDATALQAMQDLGYHVIGASIDTKDYENDAPETIWKSVARFKGELSAGGNIVLAHDVHRQTVARLAGAMLEEVRERGLRAVTVGECLGDPAEEWYVPPRTADELRGFEG